MKYISKTSEPEVLAKFKAQANDNWQPTYADFRGEDKREFHDRLIAEQGHICCYCGERIQKRDSHIEHFRPQTDHPHLELDYFNLITSCQNKIQPKEPRHCGMGKSDWFDEELLVSPLIVDCEDFFEYTLIGEILPSSQAEKVDAAKETIDKLSLNIPKLQAARAGALEGIFEIELSEDEIDKLIYNYTSVDADGKYSPHCQVVICLLKQEKMLIQSSV